MGGPMQGTLELLGRHSCVHHQEVGAAMETPQELEISMAGEQAPAGTPQPMDLEVKVHVREPQGLKGS